MTLWLSISTRVVGGRLGGALRWGLLVLRLLWLFWGGPIIGLVMHVGCSCPSVFTSWNLLLLWLLLCFVVVVVVMPRR